MNSWDSQPQPSTSALPSLSAPPANGNSGGGSSGGSGTSAGRVKRQYRAACERCKKSKTKCTWPSPDQRPPPSASVPTSCLPCSRRSATCSGYVPPPLDKQPKARQAPRATDSKPPPTHSVPPPAGPSQSSGGAAVSLAEDLFECYRRDWECAPPGLDTESLERFADAERQTRGAHDKSLHFIALAFGALTSSHPQLITPHLTPPLPLAPNDDLTPYGRTRTLARRTLVQRALRSVQEGQHMEASVQSLQVLLFATYLAAANGESGVEWIGRAVEVWRELGRAGGRFKVEESEDNEDNEAELLTELGLALLSADAAQALANRISPLLSDEEAALIAPPPPPHTAPTFDVNFELYLTDEQAEFPFEEHLHTTLSDFCTRRLHLTRLLAAVLARAIASAELHTLIEPLARLAAPLATTSSLLALYISQHSLVHLPAGPPAPGADPPFALARAQFLATLIVAEESALACLSLRLHSALSRPQLARDALRTIARAFGVYVSGAVEGWRAVVAVGSLFVRLDEACEAWVGLAVEREGGDGHELSLAELENLCQGVRWAGWSYASASIRLAELEQGLAQRRHQQAQMDQRVQTSREDARSLEAFLDLSELSASRANGP